MIKIIWNNYQNGTYFTDSNSFYENNAALKGGIYFFSNIKATFEGSQFSSSTAWYGGVIYLQDSVKLTISNCEFDNNFALLGGGVLYAKRGTIDQAGSSINITDSTFTNSTSRY